MDVELYNNKCTVFSGGINPFDLVPCIPGGFLAPKLLFMIASQHSFQQMNLKVCMNAVSAMSKS